MKTVIIDGNEAARRLFVRECGGIAEVDVVGNFNNPTEALKFAKDNTFELAVLDTEFREMDGIELGRQLRELLPDLVLIYTTERPEHAASAMTFAKADGFMVKPCSSDEIHRTLENAKLLSRRMSRRLKIVTFGRFNVFCDGELLKFRSRKAKELLALCVDHAGGRVSMEEAIDKLWENRAYDEKVKGLYRKAVSSLKDTLLSVGEGDFFVSARGACWIMPERAECEYFTLLSGVDSVLADFHGEYMFEYSWAEDTIVKLDRLSEDWNGKNNS